MAFRIERDVVIDSAGQPITTDVIVTSDEVVDGGPIGRVRIRHGFVRCRGQYYVGVFGRETPIYGGDPDGVYFAPVTWFDGEWSCGKGHVTEDAGTGHLFAGLEEFVARTPNFKTL